VPAYFYPVKENRVAYLGKAVDSDIRANNAAADFATRDD
jgi:hypothetical protein